MAAIATRKHNLADRTGFKHKVSKRKSPCAAGSFSNRQRVRPRSHGARLLRQRTHQVEAPALAQRRRNRIHGDAPGTSSTSENRLRYKVPTLACWNHRMLVRLDSYAFSSPTGCRSNALQLLQQGCLYADLAFAYGVEIGASGVRLAEPGQHPAGKCLLLTGIAGFSAYPDDAPDAKAALSAARTTTARIPRPKSRCT